MNNSPANILRHYLLEAGKVTDAASFVGFLPDKPSDAAVFYDTAGQKDGRLMRSGEVIEHPGFQILVRHLNYLAGFQLARTIAQAIDAINRNEAVMESAEVYRLDNVSRTSPVLALGIEANSKDRRHVFSINGIMTITQIEPAITVDREDITVDQEEITVDMT